MKSIEKVSLILTKFCEICHWVLAGCMVLCFLLTLPLLISTDMTEGYAAGFTQGEAGVSYTLDSLEIMPVRPDGTIRWGMLRLLALGVAVLCGLTAFIFRRANHIVRQSRRDTPFCPENLLRLRQIGWLAIAIPVTKIGLALALWLTGGASISALSLHLDELCIALVVLCLTRYFAHGAALERDVDGLV